jgi:hypothetical protein
MTAVLKNLIYDVGMNDGNDTAYYLSRGFRVVAIEANPVLVEQLSAVQKRAKCLGGKHPHQAIHADQKDSTYAVPELALTEWQTFVAVMTCRCDPI